MESNTPETPDEHRPEEAESEKGPSETARLELDALRAMLGIRKRREQPDAQPPPDDHANSST